MHVQREQNNRFSLSNMQICEVLVAFVGNCNEKFTFKIERCVKSYSMLLILYKIGGMHFRLFGAKGFHVKAKNERFTAASSCCGHNLKYENFASSSGRLR